MYSKSIRGMSGHTSDTEKMRDRRFRTSAYIIEQTYNVGMNAVERSYFILCKGINTTSRPVRTDEAGGTEINTKVGHSVTP